MTFCFFSRFRHHFFNGYVLVHVPFSPFCLFSNRHWLTCTYIMFAVPYFVYDIYAMFMCYWYKLQVKGHEDASATPKHMTSALTSYLRREFLMVLHHVVMVTVCFPVSVVTVTPCCLCGAEAGRGESNVEAGHLFAFFFLLWVTKMNWLLSQNVAKSLTNVKRIWKKSFFFWQFWRQGKGDYFQGIMFMAELSTPSVCLGKILIQVSEEDLLSCCMCMGHPEALHPFSFLCSCRERPAFLVVHGCQPLLRRCPSTISW